MTGYGRAVEYLIMRGGGAALNALIEEGYEGDGVDYDKLLEDFKRNDKAVEDLPKSLGDLQWHGQNKKEADKCWCHIQPKPEYELMVFGRNLSEIKKALDYWDEKKDYPYPIVVTQPTIRELIDAAEQLLEWLPVYPVEGPMCARQNRLRHALDRFKGVS